MPYERITLGDEARRRLLALALADDGQTVADVPDDEATAALIAARYVDRADGGALIRDEGWRWIIAHLEGGAWRSRQTDAAERAQWDDLLATVRQTRDLWVRADAVVLWRGMEYGTKHLPADGADSGLCRLVADLYEPAQTEMRSSWQRAGTAGNPAVLDRILAKAPQADRTGVDDWGRSLRADEEAIVWGEIPVDRRSWLERADEIATAWGKPLFGPTGWYGQPIEEFL